MLGTGHDKAELYPGDFNAKLIDYDAEAALLECVQPEQKNNDLIRLLENHYPNRLEIVRGGSVAMEAVSISDNTV